MKRILILVMMAAAAVACNNGKKDTPLSPKEKELLGVWACTKQITPKGTTYDNPAIAFSATADRRIQYNDRQADVYNWSWRIDGNQLILSDDEFCPNTVITELDGTYLTWAQTVPAGVFTENYINVAAILPGDWVISWSSTSSYYLSVNEDGTSTWTRISDDQDMGEYSWYLSIIDAARVQVNFMKGQSYVPLTIDAAEINHIVAHDASSNTVNLVRE